MPSVLHDLQELLEKSKELIAGPDLDMASLQTWGAQRETIFDRFRDPKFNLRGTDETSAANLVKEILEADALVVARFKQQLTLLEQKIIVTQKICRILNANADSGSPALLRRVA